MDTDTASIGAGGTLSFQRTLGTGVFGKVDHPTRHKRHLLRSRTPNDLPFPIQNKSLLREVLAAANRPSFTIHLQVTGAGMHQMAAQIGSINVEFLQENRLPIQ